MIIHDSMNQETLQNLAINLAQTVSPPQVYLLWGDLGAGKSTFSRAFIRALTKPEMPVPSPTFTLVQSYETTRGTLHHLDLYRLTSQEDLEELNFHEIITNDIVLIEWPERLQGQIDFPHTNIHIDIIDPDHRRITVKAPAFI